MWWIPRAQSVDAPLVEATRELQDGLATVDLHDEGGSSPANCLDFLTAAGVEIHSHTGGDRASLLDRLANGFADETAGAHRCHQVPQSLANLHVIFVRLGQLILEWPNVQAIERGGVRRGLLLEE